MEVRKRTEYVATVLYHPEMSCSHTTDHELWLRSDENCGRSSVLKFPTPYIVQQICGKIVGLYVEA